MGLNSEELLTLDEAMQRYGVTRITLRRRILAGELILYADPRDLRRRLVARRDLDQMFEPRALRAA
jgi:hypothetical protein